jgi:hypothetical protein
LALESVEVPFELEVRQACSHTDAVGWRQRGESENVTWGVHAVDGALIERAGIRAGPNQLIAETDLSDELLHVDIRAEEVVVEALEMTPTDLE